MLRSGPAFWELWVCGHSLQGCSRAVLTFGRANKWPLGLCQATRQPRKDTLHTAWCFPLLLGPDHLYWEIRKVQYLGWCQACWYLTALSGTSLSVHLRTFARSPASLRHPPLGPTPHPSRFPSSLSMQFCPSANTNARTRRRKATSNGGSACFQVHMPVEA